MFVSSSKGVQKNLYQGACALTMAGLLAFSAGAAPAYSADVAPGASQTNLTQGAGQPTSAAENFVWGFSSQFHQLVAKAGDGSVRINRGDQVSRNEFYFVSSSVTVTNGRRVDMKTSGDIVYTKDCAGAQQCGTYLRIVNPRVVVEPGGDSYISATLTYRNTLTNGQTVTEQDVRIANLHFDGARQLVQTHRGNPSTQVYAGNITPVFTPEGSRAFAGVIPAGYTGTPLSLTFNGSPLTGIATTNNSRDAAFRKTPIGPQPYRDTEDSPFRHEILWLGDEGITFGYGDGTYRPQENVERAAMAAYFYRLAGSPAVRWTDTSPFKDVSPDFPFYREILWMHQQGITTGYEDGTFRPHDPVNRDAMAAFFYRYAGSPEYQAPRQSPFKDVPVHSQFYREISWLASRKVTRGWADGTYRPLAPIHRDAMAAFIYQYKH